MVFPDPHKFGDLLAMLVIKNEILSRPELACFLTHFQLWCQCAVSDRPIAVLEHDAVLLAPLPNHSWINCIHYLGHHDQLPDDLGVTPYFTGLRRPDGRYEHRYRFMAGTHAYTIDPTMARRLVSDTIARGIDRSVDMFIDLDRYCVIQTGMYAVNAGSSVSTVQRSRAQPVRDGIKYGS